MQATFELTVDDVAALIWYRASRTPRFTGRALRSVLYAFLVLSILPALILLRSEKPFLETAWDIWPLLMGPLLVVLFLYPSFRRPSRKCIFEAVRSSTEPLHYGPVTLAIEPDGLRETKAPGELTRRWSSIEAVDLTTEHCFVTASGEVFIIPRRGFSSDVGFEEFVDEIVQRSGSRLDVVPSLQGVNR